MKLEDSILIEATPETVWSYLIDPSRIMAWYLPLEEFRFTGGRTSGPGATFYYVEKLPIGRVRLDFEITDWHEPERIAFRLTGGQLLKADRQSWSIEPAANGCRFRFYEEAEMAYGILGRLLEQLASISSRSNIRKMLLKLKQLAESN